VLLQSYLHNVVTLSQTVSELDVPGIFQLENLSMLMLRVALRSFLPLWVCLPC